MISSFVSGLLKDACDRIARAFKSGAARAVALNISKAFDSFWHAGLYKLKTSGISHQVFDLTSSFL